MKKEQDIPSENGLREGGRSKSLKSALVDVDVKVMGLELNGVSGGKRNAWCAMVVVRTHIGGNQKVAGFVANVATLLTDAVCVKFTDSLSQRCCCFAYFERECVETFGEKYI